MRMARRGPDLRMAGEARLDVGRNRRRMADRRDAADGETGAFAYERRVRLADRFADDLRQARRVDAPRAGRHDENGVTGPLRAKHERIRDLRDVAAEKRRGGQRGARRTGQLYDRRCDACGG